MKRPSQSRAKSKPPVRPRGKAPHVQSKAPDVQSKAPDSKPKAPDDRLPAGPTYTLHIVSDATGSLAGHLITTILTQFPGLTFHRMFHTFQDQPGKIIHTVQKFGRENQLVVHSLVDPLYKKAVRDACVALGIPHFDLTGSLVQFVSDHTGVPPVNELSRLHQVDAGYFQRIDAMEFTVQHDDGRGLETLAQADVVLLGVSRVSKTPTSLFLGTQGFKVANVSLSPQTGFPLELNAVQPKIVALTIQPKALQRIRRQRLEDFGVSESDYADLRAVIQEIVWAEAEYRRRKYAILDVTGLTIERVAASILKLAPISRRNLTYV